MKTPADFNLFAAIDQRFNELVALVPPVLALKNDLSAMRDNTPPTVQQAAQFLNLSVAIMYVRAEVSFCKRSKHLYFTRADLEAYVLLGRRGGSPENPMSILKNTKASHAIIK
jgi:hypothetical protein